MESNVNARFGRRYLIDEKTVDLIYQILNMKEETNKAKLEKARKTIDLIQTLQEKEINPWVTTIDPWA